MKKVTGIIDNNGYIIIDEDENIVIGGIIWRIPAETIPDEDFFRLLQAYPDLLQAPFTLQKVKQWRRELNGDNERTASRARDKLERIGTTLAKKETSNKKYMVAYETAAIHALLKEKDILKIENEKALRLSLKELFRGTLNNVIDDILIMPRTYGQLSIAITAEKSGLTKQTVERYCEEKGVNKYYQLLKKIMR